MWMGVKCGIFLITYLHLLRAQRDFFTKGRVGRVFCLLLGGLLSLQAFSYMAQRANIRVNEARSPPPLSGGKDP